MASGDQHSLAQQYGTSANLDARIALHQRFSVNTHGWSAWVFDQFDFPDECRILEVGCGTGGLWQANRRRMSAGWRLVLTDASDGMVETTRKQLGDLSQVVSIVQADAQALPYDDDAFDVVIANHMLYHVADLDAALAEFHRVLTPGGSLYATTLGQQQNQELFAALAPYAVDVTARMNPREIRARFSLENGEQRLAPWFSAIQLRRYEDAFRVTEVEPLVAYVQSLATGDEPVLSGDGLQQFCALVTRQIVTHGAFHITKDSGMFLARKAEEA